MILKKKKKKTEQDNCARMNERGKRRIWRTIDVVLGEESTREPESKREKSERRYERSENVHMCTLTHTHILTYKRSSTQYKNINVIIKLTG